MDPSEVNTDEILKKMGGKGGEVATNKIRRQFMQLSFCDIYFLWFQNKQPLL